MTCALEMRPQRLTASAFLPLRSNAVTWLGLGLGLRLGSGKGKGTGKG